METQPASEPLPPTLSLHAKKAAALERVLSNTKNTKEQLGMPSTFFSNGRKYPVGNSVESSVAEAQSRVHIIDNLLLEARKADNYHDEEAAALLAGLVQAELEYKIRYAEIVSKHPNIRKDLEKLMPALKALNQTEEAKYSVLH